MSDDIVGFLRARLDEDEAAALDAEGSCPSPWEGSADLWDGSGDPIAADTDRNYVTVRGAEHIARHDPARVLRDVEAGRAIVDMHADCGSGVGYCDDGGHGGDGSCGTLCYLAAVYSDHPDYRLEWKP